MNNTPELILVRLQRLRSMARNFAKRLQWPDTNESQPAPGVSVCRLCGLPYCDHPQKGGYALTCNGKLWKIT